MTEVERTAVLVLSQHAAKVLRTDLTIHLGDYPKLDEDTKLITEAILKELDEQIEAPKKKAKKSKSKKHK